MRAAWKVWLVNGNRKVFGKGPKDLLVNIEKYGSINRAADEMNMSYSKALKLMNTIEKEMGIVVLERHTGGNSGGGSYLTEDAKELISKFEQYEEESEKAIVDIFNKIF
ncbi:MAG: LysR family transcriptional regulator [Clostridiales bacterium]|nr:LysR family transcriptional regulator [Clostridiales bacterium]